MCVKNPIRKTEDLLFDYPALDSFISMAPDFDIVVINSPGLSGQFTNFNPDDFRNLVSKLVSKGHRVISTVATGICPAFDNKNVTWIGATAAKAKAVIEGWRKGDWFYCGSVLSASLEGVALVSHAASLGGIEANEPGTDNSCLAEAANERLP
jgi:hypothetical protein